MMKYKRYIPKIASIAILLVAIFGMSAHSANAGVLASAANAVFGAAVLPTVNIVLGVVFYALFTIAGWGLSLAGTLLNVSMYLTTHLGMFIDQTPAVYTVWGIIRDLSTILLIFFILFAAIQMIIGQKQADYGNMIKQIIIVGVLINFSFFFTRVMIDASNIVSLQFYNAIAPTNTASSITAADMQAGVPSIVNKLLTSGGVSDAIMGQLNITGWWNKNASNFGSTNATTAGSATDGYNMILVAVGGIIVAVITQLSFIAIAAAAILRLAMLIFLLAFSPVWIASYALPQLKALTKEWSGQFYAQLVFLPVYLAFLYVALRIITDLKLNQVGNAAGQVVGIGNAINLFVGFGIVIVMLTIPMIAAVAVTSAVGGDGGLLQTWTNGARSWAGRNVYGRTASRINESNAMRNIYARNPNLGRVISGGFSKISSNSFSSDKKDKDKGFDQVRKKQIEARTKFISGLGYDDRRVEDKTESFRNEYTSKYNADMLTRANAIEQIKNRLARATSPEAQAGYKKLLEKRQQELDTLRAKREETIKEKTEEKKKQLKDERKETATKVYEKKPLVGGVSKFNKAVAAAVRKGKTPTDEIIAALKGELGKEKSGGDEKKT